MPLIRTKKNSANIELSNLSSSELDKIISQAILLRAKKNAPSVSKEESYLLKKINKGFTVEEQNRFELLSNKLQNEDMSELERQEFLTLTNKIEKLDAKRLSLIGKLAEIRKQTFDETIKELGIGQS